jgi:DNA-binding NarL/FixJ family response regulator
MLLSQTEVNLLRMMALGFGSREIATTLELGLKGFMALYSELLTKTECWDDIALGLWWAKNQRQYLELFPNNIFSFDFNKNI